MNTLRVRLQKLLATCVSALIPAREARHRVRYCLHPLNDRRCVAYFKRRYVERTPPAALPVERRREPSAGVEYIWQCWLQGEERMPALVRRCLDSVRRHVAPGQQVVLVTEANYVDYVALPEGITALRRAGRISDAQFSDLLRVWLLSAYGGFWIDATCLMTAPIPESISRAGFFVFHSEGEFGYTLIQSCFIRAAAGNYLICRWRQLMEELWATDARLLHYFQLHLMFKAMVEADPVAREEYGRMARVGEAPTHVLQGYMKEGRAYDGKLMAEAASGSFIHKLTYKIKPDGGAHPPTFTDRLWNGPEP